MTTSEFSDAFDTLLNSHASQAMFGEGASKQEVVLDEYEKSVLLTQAQDLIVKNYFYGSQNPQGQGFDDSIRRQVDFSSLIKTATLTHAENQDSKFDDRGIIYRMPLREIDTPEGVTFNVGEDVDTSGQYKKANEEGTRVYVLDSTDVLYILNEKMAIGSGTIAAHWSKVAEKVVEGDYTDEVAATLPYTESAYTTVDDARADGWSWTDDTLVNAKDYVIIPLNYKEYDREMSKAYAQPFKKQAWRLFQNNSTGFDVQSELIPIWNVDASNSQYRVRYVKRPDPIVLADLPNGLTIDGLDKTTQCTLNPIVHMDILNKAVEIALSTRGRIAAPANRE